MSSQRDPEPTHSHRPSLARRILIVGGVAGGASCAARLRRLDESVEIAVFDRGPYVAFANCGLPYYVGDVIADEGALLIASPEMFRERFNIEVHTNTDVISIDRAGRTITVRDLRTGNSRTERYDALVLSPGAAPIRPPLPGVDLPGVFAVRNIPDSRRIRSWIADRHASTAVVVGGGFIGLEMVENLIHRRTRRHRAGEAAAGHAAARSGDGGPGHEAPDREGRAAPSRRWAGSHRRGR